MGTPVFLTHFDPAGAQRYIPLDRYNITPTFYLPDTLVPDVNVSTQRDSQHFNIRLDVEKDHCLLSVYSDEIQSVILLGDLEIEVPVSTSVHQKSFILTEEHQFITPISRWQVQWDRSGVISNSMRPPPKSFSEMLSDEEHVRQLDLLPTMDGNALVDRQELNDISIDEESGRMRIPVEDIHLPPKSLTVSTEGGESESGTQADSDRHTTSSHPNSGGRHSTWPVNKSHVASFLATFDSEENSVDQTTTAEDELSAKDSEVPESPNSPLSQDTIETEGRRTPVLVVVPSRHTNTVVGGLTKTPGLQDRVQVQGSIQLDQHPMNTGHDIDTEKGVEHSGSEDESQLQKDVRIPKRRLSEIEDEELPVKRKITKVNGQQIRRMTPEKIEGDSEPAIAFETVKDIARTPVVVNIPLISTAKSSKEKSRLSVPRKPDKQSQAPNRPAQYSAIAKTPVRQSVRKSETPASSSSVSQIGSEYGRPKVVFSSASEIPKQKRMLQAVRKLGGMVVDSIDDADVLCIGSGHLRKTSKLIIAIARGIAIVTDDWVKQAHKNQMFPPCEDFPPEDRDHEKEWGFSLSKALERDEDEVNFLAGVDVYLTTQVRRDLGNLAKDLKQVALALGADKVHAGLPSKKTKKRVLVIGSTKNVDPEGGKVNRLGHKLYVQDLITMGVLRGKLEIDSNEFMIDVPVKDEPTSSQ